MGIAIISSSKYKHTKHVTKSVFQYNIAAENPTNHASGSHFATLWCGLVPVDFTHILQGYFTSTGAIIWLPQWQWSNSEEYRFMNHIHLINSVFVIKKYKIQQN